MSVSKEEVHYVAGLAKLHLSEEEVEIKPKINGKKSKKKSKENYFGLDQNVFAPSRD